MRHPPPTAARRTDRAALVHRLCRPHRGGDFTCRRCGKEGWIEKFGTCGHGVLSDRLGTALDDDTGQIRPELRPLADLILSMPRPRSGILCHSRPQPLAVQLSVIRFDDVVVFRVGDR